MTKQFILALIITLFIFESCEKDPEIDDFKTTTFINDWEITKTTCDFEINPRDLFFISPEIGYVVGFNGDIYKTINSGESWEQQETIR